MRPKTITFIDEDEAKHRGCGYFNYTYSSFLDENSRLPLFGIDQRGIRRIKFVLFVYGYIALYPTNSVKKLGEFNSFEEARDEAQRIFDELVNSLIEPE